MNHYKKEDVKYNIYMSRRIKRNKKSFLTDLQFEIHYVDVDVEVDHEMYTDEEFQKIKHIIDTCSKHIYIDKTYVEFEDSLYEKVFLTEKGWMRMCELMAKTQFGNKCTKKQNDELIENYSLMALCYLYMILKDYGYDCAGIYLEHKDKSTFMVQSFENHIIDNYTGKWQTWTVSKKSIT